MYNQYALRLTLDDASDDVFENLKNTQNEGDAFAMVQEEGHETNKNHYHCYIITMMTIETYRARVKKRFNVRGNEDYSLKKIRKIDEYISYMAKEGDIIATDTFPDEVLDRIFPWEDKQMTDKQKNTAFKKQLKEVRDEFLNTDKNIRWYIEQYGELSARYDKPINHNSFSYHTNTLLLKKGDETFKRHFYDFLEYQSYLRLN